MLVIKSTRKEMRTLLWCIYYDPAGKNIGLEGRPLVSALLAGRYLLDTFCRFLRWCFMMLISNFLQSLNSTTRSLVTRAFIFILKLEFWNHWQFKLLVTILHCMAILPTLTLSTVRSINMLNTRGRTFRFDLFLEIIITVDHGKRPWYQERDQNIIVRPLR